MEIAYIIVGKRFKAENVADIQRQLAVYSLVSNLDSEGLGNMTVRRIGDAIDNSRYDMVQAFGDSADTSGYDVCIGKLVGNTNRDDLIETDILSLETMLAEVRQDIPDAKIIGGSYWS